MLNTPGSKTADRRRPLPGIGLGCTLLAASLLNAPSLRASDAAWSPQPAKIQAAESPDADQNSTNQNSTDQSIDAATADSTPADSVHATRLKWLPFRGASSLVTDTPQSDDDKPAFSDAAPLHPLRPARVINDPAIVRAQALQQGSPNSNPFGDEPTQPGAQPLPLPAPTTTTPTTPDTGSLAPPSTTGPSGTTPRPRSSRPRAPARLNPDLPLETPTVPPRGSAPATPFISPSPSDIEDLSCNTHQKRCQDDEAALLQNTVNMIGLDINEYGKQGDALPCDCTIGTGVVFESRHWPLITYTWKASALCHKPLYFEEVQLERYGHSAGPIVEPLLSAAHFFITVPLLPYYMGVDPPQECQYTLGYYRPGDCAPYMLDPFPLSVRGAILEAGAVGGVVWVIP